MLTLNMHNQDVSGFTDTGKPRFLLVNSMWFVCLACSKCYVNGQTKHKCIWKYAYWYKYFLVRIRSTIVKLIKNFSWNYECQILSFQLNRNIVDMTRKSTIGWCFNIIANVDEW